MLDLHQHWINDNLKKGNKNAVISLKKRKLQYITFEIEYLFNHTQITSKKQIFLQVVSHFRQINRYNLKLKTLTNAIMRKANKFKGSLSLKAVKLWAGLYLIQLHSFVSHPLFNAEILFPFPRLLRLMHMCRKQSHVQLAHCFNGKKKRQKQKTNRSLLHTHFLQTHIRQAYISHCHLCLFMVLNEQQGPKVGGGETNRRVKRVKSKQSGSRLIILGPQFTFFFKHF